MSVKNVLGSAAWDLSYMVRTAVLKRATPCLKHLQGWVRCVLCLPLIVAHGVEQPRKHEDAIMIILEENGVELGVLPHIAGSAVMLRRLGGQNLLKSDSNLWDKKYTELPDPARFEQWVDYFGHINWLGPQVDFWNQQSVRPELRGSVWPPDPYWVYAPFEVLEQSESHVSMRGPCSPYSGVRMTKHYRMQNSHIEVDVMAENTSEGVLRWNLWSNTRVPVSASVWTPVDCEESVRLEFSGEQALPWELRSGYFRFDSSECPPGGASKAFITSFEPWIAAFSEGAVFVKTFEWVEQHALPDGHARVEIFRQNQGIGRAGFIEMEAHGSLREFQPGESIGFLSQWRVFALDVALTPEEQVDWLNQHRHLFHKQKEGVGHER